MTKERRFISTLTYVHRMLEVDYIERRFTMDYAVVDFCNRMGWSLDRSRAIIKQAKLGRDTLLVNEGSRRQEARELINRALYQVDVNGFRIWYHSCDPENENDLGPTWFHRSRATKREKLKFADYLERLGRVHLKDAAHIRREANLMPDED